jgi:CelD/BcsL family acetyltransferase involved in cellulose biosynthesis
MHKREWAHSNDIDSRWVFSESSHAFLGDLLSNRTYEPDVFQVFVLVREGEPLAALITAVGSGRMHFVTVTYDQKHSKYSPGSVLLDHCVKWAFDHGLDVDFGAGTEPYKISWSGGFSYMTLSCLVLPTLWGRIGYAGRTAAKRLHANMLIDSQVKPR